MEVFKVFLPVSLQDIRDSGLVYGDAIEFGAKGLMELSRFNKHKGRFLGFTWRPVELKRHRHWWDRLVKKPVKCRFNGEDYDPFEIVDHLSNKYGLRILVIHGVKVQVFNQEHEISWNNVRFLRKIG